MDNISDEDEVKRSGQPQITEIFKPKKRIGGLDVKNTDSEINYRGKHIKKEFEEISSSNSSSAKNDVKQETRKLSLVDMKKIAKLKFNLWLPDDQVKDPRLRLNAKLYRPKNRRNEWYLLQQSILASTAPNNFSGGFLKCKTDSESSPTLSEETLIVKSEDRKERKHKSTKEPASPRVIKKKKTPAFVYGLNAMYKVCTAWDISPERRREAASMFKHIKSTRKFTRLTQAAVSACACLLIVLRKHYQEWSMKKFIEFLGCGRAQFNSAYKEGRRKLEKLEQFEHFFKRDK